MELKHAIEMAEAAMKRRDWPEAIRGWQAVLEETGEQVPPPIAYVRMSCAHRSQGDFGAAEAVVQQGMSHHSDDADLASEFVEIAIEQEDWQEAVRRAQAALDTCGARTPAMVYAQMILAHRNQRGKSHFAAAEAIGREGLALHPRDEGLAREYAELAMDQKHWPAAIERWQAVLANAGDGTPAYIYARLSVAMRRQGELEAAEAVVRNGLALHPNDKRLAGEFAEVAMAREDWDEAYRRWQAMIDAYGESAGTVKGMSITLHHRGDFEGADAALRKCLELEFSRPPQRKPPRKFVFKRIEWESSGGKKKSSADGIINLLNYAKLSPDPFAKFFPSYHALELDGKLLQGKRNPQDRLNMLPLDLTGKSVLDIGCNVGGVLFQIADRIRWGVGIELDTRLVNAANRLRSGKGAHHLNFYSFDLEKDPLPLIRDLMPEARVDIVFLLAVCAHIRNWEELIDYVAELSDTMLFEAHGHEAKLLGQVRRIKGRYACVELIGKAGSGDPSMKQRQLYFCAL